MVRPRILVVDDEEPIRQAVCRWFGMKGFDTDEATDGLNALEKCAQASYDVITMDIEMPGLGGAEIIPILKEKYPEVIIVVLTGYAGSSRETWRAHVDGVFRKPFPLKNLEVEIRLLLDKTNG
ncbi:MAG TPA: response regulator [Candidatus Hydrogenedentes bacterium]|nr:response regulator [Candidatus Hydrogenedentota bacterium]HOV72378.1 response regulator [Candidatus Hydrogenedentota bacterium]HPC16642.1 response regulator [Candidatus Hydrogenedentota bacterium]HRT22136.1 response regulator [Candidatus Hydrogenedentota bacterium]HRT63493.1 response regulator [Candidatus Hydrogenedentota bacterium]